VSDYTLYNADCLDVLPTLEPQSVDAVITSPPFNAGMEYEESAWTTLDQYIKWLCNCFVSLWDVCASGAWVICELQDMHVSPEHSHALPKQKEQFNMATGAHLTVAMIQRGFYYKGETIWDRGRWSGTPANRLTCAPGSPAILTQHSRVLFFRKPGGRKGIGHFPQQNNQWKSLWLRSIWAHVQPAQHASHPAVMPLSMARNLIAGWTLPDQTVLDPFTGTGTTGCASAIEGRRFVGIESDAAYFAIAAERIATAYEPLRHMQAAI